MKIITPKNRTDINTDSKLVSKYNVFTKLIIELNNKELSTDLITTINNHIVELNNFEGETKNLTKLLRKKQSCILNQLAKQSKIVSKNYYRNMWMALGMSIFGIPFGLMFSAALDNYGFLGIGLPMGMPIGMAIGVIMDKKAEQEGRQLQTELN